MDAAPRTLDGAELFFAQAARLGAGCDIGGRGTIETMAEYTSLEKIRLQKIEELPHPLPLPKYPAEPGSIWGGEQLEDEVT